MRAIKRPFINYNKIETKIKVYKTIIYTNQHYHHYHQYGIHRISFHRLRSLNLYYGAGQGSILEEEIVTSVDECVKKDPKGYEFKIFFVHFARNNHRLEQMVARISKEGFVPIVYNTEFDKKLGQRVERYWKVLPFTPKPVKISDVRIMTEEEAASIARPKHLDAPIVEGVVIEFEGEATA